MASKYFIGGATAVQQEDRLTPGGTIEVGDKFKVTLTNEAGATATITASATGTTVASVTADLLTAWNASSSLFKSGITASDQTTYFKLLGTAGTPFYITVTTTESDDSPADAQTFVRTAQIANQGPKDWNTANNWSDGVVPVSTDNVVLDGRMANTIEYGLNQSAVTLATLKYVRGAKAVGTANAKLRISVTAGDINLPTQDGSTPAAAFIRLGTGTNATVLNIWGSATTGLSGLEPVLWDGAHANNVLNIYGGTVGVATGAPGETSTIPLINVIGAAKVVLGSGVTATTVNQENGGKSVVRCNTTTLNAIDKSCSVTTEGAGTAGTLNLNCPFYLNSTGTIATLNIETDGNGDTTQTNNTRTVTNQVNIYGAGKLKTDLNTTYTAGIGLYRGAKSTQVTLPSGAKITPAAAA